jgi:DNA replicative helicase MCM subunit Mcm2 (Cdc46/Mcm family)
VCRDQEQRDEELFSMSILRDYITYAKANFQVLLQKIVAILFLVRLLH